MVKIKNGLLSFSIRMTTELRDKIKKQASKDGGRSSNSLIIKLIEDGVNKLEQSSQNEG